jgi:hypothetical protein
MFNLAEDTVTNMYEDNANKPIARLLDAMFSIQTEDDETSFDSLTYLGITDTAPPGHDKLTATYLRSIKENVKKTILNKVLGFMYKDGTARNFAQGDSFYNQCFELILPMVTGTKFSSRPIVDLIVQEDYPVSIEKKIQRSYFNFNDDIYYNTTQHKIDTLREIITDVVKDFSMVETLGVEAYHKFTLESILPVLDTIETNILKQTSQYQEFKKSLQMDEFNNNTALNQLAETYKKHRAYIDGNQATVDAIVTRGAIQKHIIKFVKIRSRMGLCIEKSVIPESVQAVVNVYKQNNLDPKLMKSLSSFVGLLTCKIKDVSDEFDLWQELINTNEAKAIYDYPSSFEGDADYDQLENFRIRVADIMKTFEGPAVPNSDGIKPLYLVKELQTEDEETVTVNGQEVPGYNFVLFTTETGQAVKGAKQYKPVQRGFYTAMIQDQMPGNTVGKLDKATMPAAELACMKKAVLKFMSIYFITIITHGKFHGDPHPGNLMWNYKTENGTDIGQLSVIDFGDWVHIAEDRRMALVSVGIFVLVTHFNPLPTTYTDKYICGKLANIMVKLMRLDTYNLEKLAQFCVSNNLSKTPVSVEELIAKMRQNTANLGHVRTMCINAFELRITNRLLKLAKTIPKSIDGGTIAEAFGLLKDPDVFDGIFAEINEAAAAAAGEGTNCERFGQGIYKLVEAIMKLYEFKNYLTFDKGELADLAFNMALTIVNSPSLLLSDADRVSYVEMVG